MVVLLKDVEMLKTVKNRSKVYHVYDLKQIERDEGIFYLHGY